MLDFGLLLLGILGFVIVLGVPYLLVSHTRLRARVAALEAKNALGGRAHSDFAADHASSPSTPMPREASAPWGAPKPPAKTTKAAEASIEISTQSPVATSQFVASRNGDDTGMSNARADTDSKPGDKTDNISSDQMPRPAPSDTIQQAEPQKPPRAFVFRRDLLDSLSQWLRENWVLAIGAASLALAGVFLVQYGAENGLLTPFWRVMAALGFGMALICGGEVIRRRFGDSSAGSQQHLPSALAGAGLIALFSGILSARAMYGLLDPGPALASLCLIAVLALTLGWFYGPFLSALGVIGASAAPFLVGGQSDAPWVFYYYFILVALVGLAIDTVKRWAWVSVLALAAPLGAIWLLYHTEAGELHFLIATLLIAAAAIVIPERSLWPRHSGTAMLDMRRNITAKTTFPEFTTRLSAAVICTATAAAMLVVLDATKPEAVYLGIAALVILLTATLLWMHQAPALYDHALVPGLAFLAILVIEALNFGPVFLSFVAGTERPPETAAPPTVWILTTIAVIMSGLAFSRMRQAAETQGADRETAMFWALAAAAFSPTAILLLEFFWNPGSVVGSYPWALAAIATAALMTLLAERTARGNSSQQRALRVALFAIAALTLIALAVFLLLAKTALTLALAVMVLLTVLIDRRFDLPALGLFVQVGVAVITYRLIIDPGFGWATAHSQIEQSVVPTAALLQVLLAYLGTLGLLAGAFWLARDNRPKTALILESAIATIAAIFISVMISRILLGANSGGHAEAGLMATVWAASMVNQLYRLQSSSRFSRAIRSSLAGLYGLALLSWMSILFGFSNPLVQYNELVSGPPILDSLFAAFIPLSGIFALAAWKIRHFGSRFQITVGTVASLLAAYYVALEIRRSWRGDDLTVAGISDPELYSYTLALLAISVGLLALSFWRRSDKLRKLAMAGVVLTIAKVFLVDMSGLSGLTRVFSFMGLGLALVALAWLNRLMNAQWDRFKPTSAQAGAQVNTEDETQGK